MIWKWSRAPIKCFALALLLFGAPAVVADPATTSPSTYDKPPLKKEELEQLLAPIALFPDALLTQMLMATTYPLEVVQADRWVKEHKDLKGDALAKELEKKDWDASVKSLVNFPEQLSMMNEKLDLTVKIGNAFLEQQADVLNTVQVLRNRAEAAGNLKSNEQQKVQVQSSPTTAGADSSTVVNVDTSASSQLTPPIVQAPPQIITIESPSPDVIYVPSYNPTYVYGGWPYPSYPPYYYYPSSYYYPSNIVSFGFGVACGAAWGYAWGNCNWGGGDVDIDVNRNFNRNTNINRDQARQNMQNRQTNRGSDRQSWQHDSSHRRGAAYRDQRTADRFGGANSSSQAAQARERYRGRAESGRQELARGGADQFRGAGGADRGAAGYRGSPGGGGSFNDRGASAGSRSPSAGSRSPSAGSRSPSYSGTRGGTFSGVSGGSSGARMESSRGRSSGGSYRSAPSRSSGGSRSGGFSGGSRGGGGGARGGGGRGGGRR